MNIWDIRSRLYLIFRKRFLFRLILEQEKRQILSLLSHLELHNTLVLDLGCGNGDSIALLPKSTRIIGVDISPAMLHVAKRNYAVPLIQADVMLLPFKPDSFDVITAIGISEYQPDFELFISTISSILKYQGCVLVTSSPPTFFSFFRRLLGVSISTISGRKIISIAMRTNLCCVGKTRSFMQDQFLFQKLA